MKATGVIRKVDQLGRIVFPKELRIINRWNEGTPLEIFTDDNNTVILREYNPCCVFCGMATDIMFKGKHVCNSCRDDM